MIAKSPPRRPEATRLIHNVSWTQLEEIDRALADWGVRLVYLDGTLELMTLSEEHEDAKTILRMLLEAYMRAKQIRFYSRGSATLGSQELGARKEPDESYNLNTRKLYPDLILEVVRTSDGIDALVGYHRLGVAEVWFWEDGVLDFCILRNEGYEKMSRSQLLPDLPIDTFLRYSNYHDQYDAVNDFLAEISS
jgi:Uma2 family endonuclease